MSKNNWYFKIIYTDGHYTLFSTNMIKAADLIREGMIKAGKQVQQLSKEQYEELEAELP